MIAYDPNGKINYQALERKGTLPESVINQYDYVEMKKDFELVVDLLETNKLVHSMYEEALKYEITDELEFKIFIDDNLEDYTITIFRPTEYKYISKNDNSIITIDRATYDRSIKMCMYLLKKVKASYEHLNEVEKFILKSLEFDKPPETDESIMGILHLYKNGYYLSKKSAFIKMALQLNIQNAKQLSSEELIKLALAEEGRKIVTLSDD